MEDTQINNRTVSIKDRWLIALPDTPLGRLNLIFGPKGLALLLFEEDYLLPGIPEASSDWMMAVGKALQNYFAGASVDFPSIPLNPRGTPFQLRVWEELRRIPTGSTISYRELAHRVGSPKGFRAVGQANAANPIPIIVPCHRVIHSDGSLGGYSSGPDRKRWLLRHEGVF